MSESSESIPPPPSPVGSVPPSPKGNPLTKVLVAVVLLVVVGGGLAIWILSHRGGAARATAEQFVRELLAGNVSAARAMCLDSVAVDQLERQAKDMQGWGSINNMTMVARELPTGPATPAGTTAVEGDIDFANVRKAFSTTMVKQPDQTYKIREFAFR